jgi:hypothetical protein
VAYEDHLKTSVWVSVSDAGVHAVKDFMILDDRSSFSYQISFILGINVNLLKDDSIEFNTERIEEDITEHNSLLQTLTLDLEKHVKNNIATILDALRKDRCSNHFTDEFNHRGNIGVNACEVSYKSISPGYDAKDKHCRNIILSFGILADLTGR